MTLDTLRKLLEYLPDTGDFIWLTGKRKGLVAGSVDQSTGYVRINVGGKLYAAHRLAFLFMTETWPLYVDHIDGNGANNAWINLRQCTLAENQANQKLSKANTSGVKGVTFHKPSGRFRARIQCNLKVHYLGYYDTCKDAEAAIRAARVLLHKEFTNHGDN